LDVEKCYIARRPDKQASLMSYRKRQGGGEEYTIAALDPTNVPGVRRPIIIPRDVYLEAYKHWPVQYENLRCVKYVLENTQRIFSGVRDHVPGGWCYTGRPLEWHVRPNVTAAFPHHLIFAVYVNPKFELFDWLAEKADPQDATCPVNWRDRYKGRVL
jgi:hypothetical protein